MTQNQIRYAEHLENQRHNKVSEAHEHYDVFSNKRKSADAAVRTAASKEEANRINWFATKEQQRSNLAREEETFRSNRAKELETSRSNLEREKISAVANEINRQHFVNQDEATFRRLDTEWNQLENQRNLTAEQVRHNYALEGLTEMQHKETARANLANENISKSNIGLGYSQLAEASRTHRVNEGISARAQASTQKLQEEQGRAVISQAMSASRQAGAAETSASARVVESGAAVRQADVAELNATTNRKNATSNRITAISGAVRTGSEVASQIGKLLLR